MKLQLAGERSAGRRSVMRYLVALCIVMLIGAPVPLRAADPSSPAWQGVWRGAIGALPVRVCLAGDRVGPGDAFGSYYYLSKLRAIRLEQQRTSKVWVEGYAAPKGPPAPRWTFAEVGRDRLTGVWSDGRRLLPFQLTRLASGDEAPCGTDAFNGPRWRPLTVKATPAVKDGVHYQKLVFGAGPAFPDVSMEGFALIGEDEATRRINASLRARVPGPQKDWRGCVTGSLASHGTDGDLSMTITPTLITPRWLGVTLSEDDDCGGVHPNSGTVPFTFDRATGVAVKLHDWLSDAAVDRSRAINDLPPTIRPKFRRLIIAQAGDIETDCRDAISEEEFWDIGLDRRGITFQPELPHVSQACANDVLVTWATLAQFLTQAGRAGRTSLSRN